MKSQCSKLENGLTVITDHIPDARGASVYWVLRAGARQDDIPGTAHFFEHMLCSSVLEGSEREVVDRLEEISPSRNFATGAESINGYAHVLPEHAEEVIRIFGGIATKPVWTLKALETQRAIILNEHAEGQASHFSSMFNLARAKLYAGHPLGRKVLGEADNIEAMQAVHLLAYMQDHFLAGDMALIVSGPMTYDEVEVLVRESFAAVPAGKTVATEKPAVPQGEQSGLIIRPRDQQFIMLISDSCNAMDSDCLPLRDMMSLMRMELTEFLRNEGYSYEGVYMCGSAGYSDHGYSIISYDILPDKADESLRAVADFIATPDIWLTEAAFEKLRLQDRTVDAFNFLNPNNRVEPIARHFEMTGEFMSYEDIQARDAAVDFASMVAAYERFRATPQSIFGCGPCESLPSPQEVNAIIRGEAPRAPALVSEFNPEP